MASTPPAPTPAEQPGADPSMEDILASIRRILNEDEATPAESVPPQPGQPDDEAAEEDEVLVLDTSMIVAPGALSGVPSIPPAPSRAPVPAPPPVLQPVSPPMPIPAPLPVAPSAPPVSAANLLAPESEAAAVSSVGSLLQMLTKERSTQVHRGGPTIEDLVREEIRPLLKDWLDAHLPPLVERLVRVEIERVTGRATR